MHTYPSTRRAPLAAGFSPISPTLRLMIDDMDRRWLRRAIARTVAGAVFSLVLAFGVAEVGMGDTMPLMEPLYVAAHHGHHSATYNARGWDKGLAAAAKSDAKYWEPTPPVAPAHRGWSVWDGWNTHAMDQ